MPYIKVINNDNDDNNNNNNNNNTKWLVEEQGLLAIKLCKFSGPVE